MQNERFLTVIIPTWNMGRFLAPLARSILDTRMASVVAEIIFVCEKSDDGSEAAIAAIASAQGDRLPRVTLLQPDQRRGLFVARYLGAKAARTPKVMFVDSRIVIPARTAERLPETLRRYPALSSVVDIDIDKNIFCLYWQRSHEAVFSRTHREREAGFTVTAENFDRYRIGGTSFVCSRDLLLSVSEKYLGRQVKSDDTLVMREMVEVEPFSVDPDYRIQWEPRDEWWPFLKHLYQRGPGFAEYHVYEKRGWLFWAVMLGGVGLAGLLVALIVWPALALSLLAAGLAAFALSAWPMSRTFSEFLRIAPLHACVIVAYGLGALRGVYVVGKKRIEERHQRRARASAGAGG